LAENITLHVYVDLTICVAVVLAKYGAKYRLSLHDAKGVTSGPELHPKDAATIAQLTVSRAHIEG